MTTRAASRHPAHILLLIAFIASVFYLGCMTVALSEGKREAPIELRVIFAVLGITASVLVTNWLERQIWKDTK